MRSFIQVSRDIALLLVRLVTAFILVMHGWARYQKGPEELINHLDALGVSAPTVVAWGTMAFELFGGLLLFCGLGTPVIGLLLLVQQVALIAIEKWEHGFLVTEGGYEYSLALASVGALLMVFGSGRTGMDHLFMNDPIGNERRLINDADPA